MPARLFAYDRKTYFTHPEARVVVRREPSQAPTRKHVHEFAELVVVLSGTATHEVDQFIYSIRAGDIYFINRSHSHAYRKTVNLNLANILIREDFFAELQPAFAGSPGYLSLFTLGPSLSSFGSFASRMHLNKHDLATLSGLITSMENEACQGTIQALKLAESWLTIIVGFLCRAYQPGAGGEVPVQTRFVRLLSWMEQHFGEPIRISQLSRMAVMSERTFMRRFRETMGLSPLEYVLRIRMQKARQLLEGTQKSPGNEEIARLCGFEGGNYFSRQFRKRHGCSPRAWRKRSSP